MGSNKSVASFSLVLSLNLLLFSMVSSKTLAPAPVSQPPRSCPELGFCVNILGGRIIGSPSRDCCPILGGLADFDAMVCICDILKSEVLGIPINLEIAVIAKQIFNFCHRNTTNLICD